MKPQLKLTREMLIRIVADAVMINIAFIFAFYFRFISITIFEFPQNQILHHKLFWDFISNYSSNSWIMTLICLLIFYVSGFYTFGRAYQSRFKLVIITQAVTISFLLYGFISYFVGVPLRLPRGVLVLSWLFSLTILIATRLWSSLWGNVLRVEKRLIRIEPGASRRVLVIGGAGYIGSALLPKLLDTGYRVRLLDLLIFGTEPINDMINHSELEIMQADFRQVEKVVEAIRDIDHVIHLGAIVGDPACSLNEELTIQVNLEATRMIGEVAKASGVGRFVFASTCSVYGASDEILDERSALNPVSLYARSKIASEKVLMNIASEAFIPILLRFSTIYGLSGRNRFDLVVNLLAAKAIIDGVITVFGGDQWRPFLHVDDAALSILKVIEAPISSVRNQVFNVGSDEQNYTILQVAQIIQHMVPAAQLINSVSDSDKRNYRVSFKNIRQRIDFIPQWSLMQGIQQVVNAIENGSIKDYQDSRYSNVKFLTEDSGSNLINYNGHWAHELIKELTL